MLGIVDVNNASVRIDFSNLIMFNLLRRSYAFQNSLASPRYFVLHPDSLRRSYAFQNNLALPRYFVLHPNSCLLRRSYAFQNNLAYRVILFCIRILLLIYS